MRKLVCDVAFEAGDSEGEGVEGKGKVVGAVCECAAQSVFDATVRDLGSL